MSDGQAADAGNTSLVDDADYVLREIARGEVLGANPPNTTIAVVDALSQAVIAWRGARPPTPANLAAVETLLTKLMGLISPITVQTLRDTDRGTTAAAPAGRASIWPFNRMQVAQAYRFSDLFFWLTIFTVFVALNATYWAETDGVHLWDLSWDIKTFGRTIAPFSYGAMGACVFLLRSLHVHIYERTFDRRRRPEYFNRVLLGAISGGALVLLLHGNSTGSHDGVVPGDFIAKVGTSALGFLAGYNTDLLFSAIERITEAVFPKPAEKPPAK